MVRTEKSLEQPIRQPDVRATSVSLHGVCAAGAKLGTRNVHALCITSFSWAHAELLTKIRETT